jgi:glycerol-3-phosphate dehydrogenase subunit C
MSSPGDRTLTYCISCNNCQLKCPVLAQFREFPGPRYLGPMLERHRLMGEALPEEVEKYLAFCTNCKRCDLACPQGVRPSSIHLNNKMKSFSWNSRAFRDWILAHNVWWGMMGSAIGGPFNFLLATGISRFFMTLIGIAPRKFPEFRKKTAKAGKAQGTHHALYFPGCYARFNEPDIMQAAVDILEACDYSVEIFPARCCGTPMLTNALEDESREIARKNADQLLGFIDRGYTVVTTCSSCGLALKSEYAELIDASKAGRLAAHVWDLFELIDEEGHEPFSTDRKKLEGLYYHVSCHLKNLGTGAPAARFLRDFAASHFTMEDGFCCGIAGTFGFKKEKFELARKVGAPLFAAIKASNASTVATDCGTCAIQISDETGLPVMHPAVILREYLKQ